MRTTSASNSRGKKKPRPSQKSTGSTASKPRPRRSKNNPRPRAPGPQLTPPEPLVNPRARFQSILALRLIWAMKESPIVLRIGEPSTRLNGNGSFNLSVSLQDDEQKVWELYLNLMPAGSRVASSTMQTVALFWRQSPPKPLT